MPSPISISLADLISQQFEKHRLAQAHRDALAAQQAQLERQKMLDQQQQENADRQFAQQEAANNQAGILANRKASAQDAVFVANQARQNRSQIDLATSRAQEAYARALDTKDPNTIAAAERSLGQLMRTGQINRFDFTGSGLDAQNVGERPTPEAMRQASVLGGVAAGQPLPAQAKPQGPDYEAQRLALERDKFDWQKAHPKAGGVTVNVGPNGQPGGSIPLTQAEQTDTQKQVMSAEKSLAQLDRIDKAVNDLGGPGEVASYGSRIGSAATQLMSQTPLRGTISQESKDKLRKRQEADAEIATFRNNLYHDLTGAAVNPEEAKRLAESIPETTDPAYAAKMAVWRRNFEYARKYGYKALAEGLSLGPATQPENSKASGSGISGLTDAQLEAMQK